MTRFPFNWKLLSRTLCASGNDLDSGGVMTCKCLNDCIQKSCFGAMPVQYCSCAAYIRVSKAFRRCTGAFCVLSFVFCVTCFVLFYLVRNAMSQRKFRGKLMGQNAMWQVFAIISICCLWNFSPSVLVNPGWDLCVSEREPPSSLRTSSFIATSFQKERKKDLSKCWNDTLQKEPTPACDERIQHATSDQINWWSSKLDDSYHRMGSSQHSVSIHSTCCL